MLRWVIRRIRSANKEQISKILEEAVRRYNALYPEWEVLTLSVQRSEGRSEQLEAAIRLLRSLKDPAP